MATIKKRGEKYTVIYDYLDVTGTRKQKWETFLKKEDAVKRKTEIEFQKAQNTFVSPSSQTVRTFLKDWVNVHAKSHWQFNTLTNSLSLIDNHILPTLGDMEMQRVTSRDIEMLYDTLRMKKVSGTIASQKDDSELRCLSSTTVRHVHSILKSAFDKAVEWDIIAKTPVICDAPKKNRPKKTIWTAPMVSVALSDIEHSQLHLAVHLAFICSLRIGEAMGLTWDSINFDNSTIQITKTLQRVKTDALKAIPSDHVYLKFPAKIQNKGSALILKNPKTENSNRVVYMTQPLADELKKRKEQTQREKWFLADEYLDNNMVFCLEDGTPIEPKLCEKWFLVWQGRTELEFPQISFHEIRHSSATYKLVESNGDHKAVQGDLGHASAKMSLDTYAHIQDPRRKGLMQTIESDFYHKGSSTGTNVPPNLSANDILKCVENNPELLQILLATALAKNA